ncbi:MAG: hypothetical protein ACI4KN_09130, partial [Gemmiger sp.]
AVMTCSSLAERFFMIISHICNCLFCFYFTFVGVYLTRWKFAQGLVGIFVHYLSLAFMFVKVFVFVG